MTIRKADVYRAYRVGSALGWQDMDKKVSSSTIKSMVAKAKADKDVGANGAAALQKAYDEAKAKAGGEPTRAQIRAVLSRAESSIKNETAAGRVNDGYIDKREAGALKSETAKAIYKYLDLGKGKSAETSASELKHKATFGKIDSAVKKLLPVVEKGFKLYDPDKDDDGMGLSRAMRQAANDAGLSGAGRAVVMTAVNGATSRGDGDSGPNIAAVKRLITNAQSKLKESDGAKVVDFARPDKAPVSKKDKTVTGLELDRTPAATGMTSRALLEFAGTL